MSEARSKADQVQLRVVVDPDKTRAELIIPAQFERSMLGPAVCHGFLQQAGIELSDAVRRAVDALVKKAQSVETEDVRGLVARAVAPVDGEDGYIEWTVDDEANSDADDAAEEDEDVAEAKALVDEDKAVSHYERSAFVVVEPSQIIGQIHRATPGEDGRDVRGGTLRCRPGREVELKVDESLMIDAAGQIIAQDEGVLIRNGNTACIRKQIIIDQYVDFSTGNIDFNGDVVIRRGVRDCFVVKAEGNVEVHGLIEAAHIITGRDLLALGGFAGRERGQAHIGRDLRGKYLDNVEGEVLQDLKVDREVINCAFTVHGRIESPHGTLIGGHFVVTGRVHVAQLGSNAGVATVLILGSVPRLEPLHRRLNEFIASFEQRKAKLLDEQKLLDNLTKGNRATADQKERQTELMFEIMQADNALMKGKPALDRLDRKIEAQRTVEVKVERKLCQGVRFVFNGCTYRVVREQRGPLTLTRDTRGQLVYRLGDGAAQPLHEITEIETANRAA